MSKFRFRLPNGNDATPSEWLCEWAAGFPNDKYPGYEELIGKHKSFSPADFEQIGRWKDAALKGEKPNVASVAYAIWMQAASELPGVRFDEILVESFLADWSEREYTEVWRNGLVRRKRFGLSRATA